MTPMRALLFLIFSFRSTALPSATAGRLRGRGQTRKVGVHHHADKLLKGDRRLPAQRLASLRRITDEMVHLRRPEECGIDPHERLPVEPDVFEGGLDEL